MTKYAIRRISLGSTLKFGFVLGLLLSLFPSLLCGLAGAWGVSTAHRVMAGWRDVRLEILGQPVRFDLIDLLNLGELLGQLRFLDQNDWLFALILVLVVCCAAALVVGLSANLLTLGYNALAWLTGGLIVELRELDDGRRHREIVVERIERPLVSRGKEASLETVLAPAPAVQEGDRPLLEAAPERPAAQAELSVGSGPGDEESEPGGQAGSEEHTYTEI